MFHTTQHVATFIAVLVKPQFKFGFGVSQLSLIARSPDIVSNANRSKIPIWIGIPPQTNVDKLATLVQTVST